MRRASIPIAGAAAVLAIKALCAAVQAPQEFEVASIRPDQSENRGSSSQNSMPGGRFAARNVSPKMLIERAFAVAGFQIEGPGWLDTDRYDIIAKADTAKELSPDELRPPLRKLLTDRFSLQCHSESKILPVYSLVVSKNGVKLTAHTAAGGPSTEFRNQSGTMSISGAKQSMAHLTLLLGQQLDRTVIDNTGLTGEYDFKLEWAADETAESARPSIFTALQDQLGLKLESKKGPVEVIVIDRVEKPSDN